MPISRTFIQIISKNGFWGVFSVFSFFFPSIHKLYLTWLYCKELQFMTFTFLDLLSTPLVVSFLCLLSISLEHYVVYGKQKWRNVWRNSRSLQSEKEPIERATLENIVFEPLNEPICTKCISNRVDSLRRTVVTFLPNFDSDELYVLR